MKSIRKLDMKTAEDNLVATTPSFQPTKAGDILGSNPQIHENVVKIEDFDLSRKVSFAVDKKLPPPELNMSLIGGNEEENLNIKNAEIKGKSSCSTKPTPLSTPITSEKTENGKCLLNIISSLNSNILDKEMLP